MGFNLGFIFVWILLLGLNGSIFVNQAFPKRHYWDSLAFIGISQSS